MPCSPEYFCHPHQGISVTFTQESLPRLHGRLCRIFPALSLREQDEHGEHPRASAQKKVTQESGSCPLMAAREIEDWKGHARLSHKGLLTLRTSAAPQAHSLEEALVLVPSVWRPRSSLQLSLCSDERLFTWGLNGCKGSGEQCLFPALDRPRRRAGGEWAGSQCLSLRTPTRSRGLPCGAQPPGGSVQPAQLGATTLLIPPETYFSCACQ